MKFFKRSDVVIIAVILVLSLVFGLVYDQISKGKATKAEIYYYSQLIETVPLDTGKERDFSLKQNPNIIFHLDKQGNIAFVASDCPDKICVKTGKLHRVGEYAACLPNGVILKIVPSGDRNDDDPDIVINN